MVRKERGPWSYALVVLAWPRHRTRHLLPGSGRQSPILLPLDSNQYRSNLESVYIC